MLNSLEMGFRTLAIQKRSSEVWQLLAAVKTEFGKYGDVLDKVQKRLQQADRDIALVRTRERAIGRRLRGVEQLPEADAGTLLQLDGIEQLAEEKPAEAEEGALDVSEIGAKYFRN